MRVLAYGQQLSLLGPNGIYYVDIKGTCSHVHYGIAQVSPKIDINALSGERNQCGYSTYITIPRLAPKYIIKLNGVVYHIRATSTRNRDVLHVIDVTIPANGMKLQCVSRRGGN